MRTRPILLSLALGAAATALEFSTPKWPYGHQLAQEEHILYEGIDLGSFSTGCTPARTFTSVAAQWIRLAYHDMSTHNVDDGTGGLDASIRFELDRAENVGGGMISSLADFSNLQTPYISMSDLIAMGTIFAYGSCGGPSHASIPYRAGRKDATTAGPPGVPEPHQDVESHIESFRRQGFNQEEMIALIACGHTVGGVAQKDFPDMVATDTLFDGEQKYSPLVVTGYLNGTTPNPLVVTSNVTLRPDLRAFASDGNVTMQRLAQGNNLDTTCASLIERMINTVPKDVQLTEPILPIQYKVGRVRLYPSSANGSADLILETRLRILDFSDNPNRIVKLFWNDREGEGESTCPVTGCSVQHTSHARPGGTSDTGFRFLGTSVETYTFRATINASSSISKFWFEIHEDSSSEGVTLVDNGGEGYVIDQDDVLFDPTRSTRYLRSVAVQIVVAVKTSKLSESSNLTLNTFCTHKILPPQFIPKVFTGLALSLADENTWPSTARYTFFTTERVEEMSSFDVVFEGRVVQEYAESEEIVNVEFSAA